jgi:hypothetical protein
MTVSTAQPASPVRRTATLVLVGIGLALAAYYVFLLTHGTFRLVGKERGWRIFPALWASLREGRFDVAEPDVHGEGFIRDGKTYSYYGLFPAVLRGFASLFARLDQGGVSQALCALAATLTALSPVVALGRLGLLRGWSAVLFCVCVAVGSPLITAMALADVYDEAILWGCAWAAVGCAAFVVWVESERNGARSDAALLLLAGAFGLALHSRPTSGLCVAFELLGALGWLAWRRRKGLSENTPRAVAAAIGLALTFVALQGYVNQQRWGNPFEFRPMELHEQFLNNTRGQVAAYYGRFRLDRLPASACYYFVPESGNLQMAWPPLRPSARRCFGADFPYEEMVTDQWQIGGQWLHGRNVPYYDLIDGPRFPLTLVSPGLVLFALLGLLAAFQSIAVERRGATFLLAFVGLTMVALLCTMDTLALRYEMDFLPPLVGLGLFGVLARPRGWGPLQTVTLTLVVCFSVVASHVAMLNNKVFIDGSPRLAREAAARTLGQPLP